MHGTSPSSALKVTFPIIPSGTNPYQKVSPAGIPKMTYPGQNTLSAPHSVSVTATENTTANTSTTPIQKATLPTSTQEINITTPTTTPVSVPIPAPKTPPHTPPTKTTATHPTNLNPDSMPIEIVSTDSSDDSSDDLGHDSSKPKPIDRIIVLNPLGSIPKDKFRNKSSDDKKQPETPLSPASSQTASEQTPPPSSRSLSSSKMTPSLCSKKESPSLWSKITSAFSRKPTPNTSDSQTSLTETTSTTQSNLSSLTYYASTATPYRHGQTSQKSQESLPSAHTNAHTKVHNPRLQMQLNALNLEKNIATFKEARRRQATQKPTPSTPVAKMALTTPLYSGIPSRKEPPQHSALHVIISTKQKPHASVIIPRIPDFRRKPMATHPVPTTPRAASASNIHPKVDLNTLYSQLFNMTFQTLHTHQKTKDLTQKDREMYEAIHSQIGSKTSFDKCVHHHSNEAQVESITTKYAKQAEREILIAEIHYQDGKIIPLYSELAGGGRHPGLINIHSKTLEEESMLEFDPFEVSVV